MKKFFALAIVLCLFAVANVFAASETCKVLVLQDLVVNPLTGPDNIVLQTNGTAILPTNKYFKFEIKGGGAQNVAITWGGSFTVGGTGLTMLIAVGATTGTLPGVIGDLDQIINVQSEITSCTAASATPGWSTWTETCTATYTGV